MQSENTAPCGTVTENTAFCNACKKQVHFHVKPVNHALQFVIVLLTVGIWLPVWLTMTFCRTRLCNECGEPIWKD
jgi:hypothetical protein